MILQILWQSDDMSIWTVFCDIHILFYQLSVHSLPIFEQLNGNPTNAIASLSRVIIDRSIDNKSDIQKCTELYRIYRNTKLQGSHSRDKDVDWHSTHQRSAFLSLKRKLFI